MQQKHLHNWTKLGLNFIKSLSSDYLKNFYKINSKFLLLNLLTNRMIDH